MIQRRVRILWFRASQSLLCSSGASPKQGIRNTPGAGVPGGDLGARRGAFCTLAKNAQPGQAQAISPAPSLARFTESVHAPIAGAAAKPGAALLATLAVFNFRLVLLIRVV